MRWSRIMHEHWTQRGGSLVAKIQFKTLEEALAFMEKRKIKDTYHAYVCSECGMWHIAHNK